MSKFSITILKRDIYTTKFCLEDLNKMKNYYFEINTDDNLLDKKNFPETLNMIATLIYAHFDCNLMLKSYTLHRSDIKHCTTRQKKIFIKVEDINEKCK